MRPLYQVLRHLLFASLTRAQFGVQNDRSVLGINNEFSGVCYTYVSVYPVLADPDYITITKPYRGSVTTQYTVPPQGDEPGIIIVEQPGGSSAPENVVIPATDDRSYVIIIRPHSGPNPISAPITQVVPPRSGQPGQIIIETPETQVGDATPGVLQPLTLEPKELTGYVTVLRPLTGTLASLQLITISPTGTNRGSVIINVPTSALNGGSLQGLTLEPAQDGDYVTVIEPAGTAFSGTVPIRLTVPPSNGNPGTVIIQTPVPGTLRPLALEPLTPNTLGALGLAGQTITLQPADATGYVTIIEPAEGSVTPTAPIRTTIPPTGTKPGTVLIQTPPGWNDGGDGAAFQPTRTRPQGSVSYTTVTRGVPMGMGGSESGSNGGSNGGSGSGDGSGDVQGLPGQGGDDESGPRQTLTIPPEGGNPGTVLVLTPEDPNNPQTGNNGGGDNGAQATGGSSGGNQGGSGGGSGSSSGGNGGSGGSSNNGGSGDGTNSGSGSSSGQGGSSSNGGSSGNDDDPVQGGVQGSGSGSEGNGGDGASGDGGSSGSNNGNGSGNGGSSSSGGSDTDGSSGSGGTQGGAQGGSDSEDVSGGSGTRSAGSSSSTKGASSGGTESEGGGSEGGSDYGNGSSGGSGSTSGDKGSSGDGDGDSGSGGNNAGGANGGSGQSSSSRRGSTSRRPNTRSPIVRTSPSTYIVTSSSTVFTITADVVETLTAEPQKTRRSSSTQRLTGGVEGLGGSGTAVTERTTFRRPSNSRSTGSAAVTAGGAASGVDTDSPETTQAPGSPSSTRRAGASSNSGYTGTVDTRVRPGGGGMSSSRSRTSTSGQASRSSNGETTIVDSGPVITNDPGSDAEEATSSVGNAAQSSSTRSSSASQSTSAQRPVAETSSPGTRFTARPAVISTNGGNAGAGGTSQVSQGSSRATSPVSGFVEGDPVSTAAGNNGGPSSEDDEATSPALRASSNSQSTRFSGTGSPSASERSSASTTSREGSSVSDAARGSSAGTSTVSQGTGQSSRTSTTSEEFNFETLIGTQSVPESERVEQPDDTSTRAATSSGAGLTGQPAAGVGGSTTVGSDSQTTAIGVDDDATTSSGEPLAGGPAAGATSGSAGVSSVSDDSDAEISAASRDPGSETTSDDTRETEDATSTVQPEDGETSLISPPVPVPTDPLPETESSTQSLTGGVEGITAIGDSSFESPELPLPTAVSTGPLPDSNLLSTATNEESSGASPGFEVPTGSQAAPSDDGLDPGLGETGVDGPTGSETSDSTTSSNSLSDEASETVSADPDETGTGASTQPSQSGLSGDGDSDGTSTADEAGAEPSETDADAESETSGPDATDGTGSGAGPTTDEDGQTITDTSGGNPTAVIPADNSLTTEAPDGALATITVFRAGRGSARTTLYIPPQASNDPWTMVIETPVSETQSEAATARGDDDVLATTSGIGGNTNVTIFRAGSSPARRTLYVPPRFANEPGTIVIETPTGTAIATATETGIDTPGVRPNITVYSSGTASSRITIYVPPTASDGDGYIIIETPVFEGDPDTTGSAEDGSGPTAGTPAGIANVTVYSSGTASERRTIYIPPTAPGEAGTIIIETPVSEPDAEETGDSGSQTTGLEPGVRPNVTVYSSGTASERITLYIPPTSGEAGTIIIQTPVSGEGSDTITGGTGDESGNTATSDDRTAVTIYTEATGSTGNTRYISPTASGELGTYIIETLASEAEEETASDDSAEATGPGASITPVPTDEVSQGGSGNVTLYRAGEGSERSTIFIPPETTGDPWTIVIETPISQTELVETGTIPGFQTTVSAITGSANLTIFRAGVASTRKTIYVGPKTSGAPGTVIIETPVPRTQTGGLTANPEAQPTLGAGSNTTIFVPGTGPGRTTYYVPPSDPNDPGTVYVETPVSGAETEELTDGPSATGDDDDAIIAATTFTIFSGGSGSVTRTVYVPPTVSGEAGTLYIETPTGSEDTATGEDEIISATRTVTVYTGVPGSVTRTVYVPPTAIGEPGTLFVETPVYGTQATATDDEDAISAVTTVTVFSGGPGSVTRSVYIPPTASGEAGTLIIETPTEEAASTATDDDAGNSISAATTVTIFSGGPASVTRTVYIPPTASGEAGTLIIETPTDGPEASQTASGNAEETEDSTETGAPTEAEEEAISAATTVTIFSGGPAAVTRTTYIPPTASGEAGTLVIVTPTGESDAETTGDGDDSSETGSVSDAEEITARTTVTIFSGGSGSATQTIYIPPTASGEAGTLIVETPTSGPNDGDDSSITGTGAGGPTAIVTPEGPGNVTIYSGGPASSTTTRFIPPTASGEPGTVVIETPTAGPQATGIGNVTIVTGGPATVTQTRYIPATVTDEPGTIVIETPTSQVDEDGSAGNTTIYSAVSATGTRTIYIPPTVSGEPGTVIIETPAVRAVTVITDGPASTTRTLTIPGTASGDPDTIFIETPTSGSGSGPANVTVYTGVSATVATTRFIPGTASDEPGTFIVETPIGSPIYVTVYSGGPGTAVTTIYLTPSESGDSTTMIIQTPTQGSEGPATDDGEVSETGTITEALGTSATRRGNVTIYTQAPGTAGGTFYFPPDDPEESGTIIIETLPGDAEETGAESTEGPVAPTAGGRFNTTIFSGGPVTAPRTLYISATISGEPDIVLVETPTTGPEAEASESTTGQRYTTIFGGGSGTATRTITIPATVSGELDTILIETPTGGAPEVTITRGGPVSVTTTITIPGAPGEPDTVLVEIPTESGDSEPPESANGPDEVTSTRGGPVTVATTITIPGQSGQPDTVIIETPTRAADVTITRGGPVSVATTVTIPGAPGEPDTVLVERPIESADLSVTGSGAGEITSTRGGPVTAATTITIPGISGQPDTVIIETPTSLSGGEESTATRDGPVEVTSTRGGPVTAATTITIPGESGQPDTVIVETPTRSSDDETTEAGGSPGEVTSTRGGPVTEATTITIPGESGEPDTVIVETPTTSNEPPVTGGVQAITSTRGGPVTAATTITIPGESGQPDTVIIETPRSSDEVEPSATEDSQDEVTITRGGPVTAATTVTIPGVSGGPDTVFIEIPTTPNEASVTGGLQAITSTRGGAVTAATTITIPGESGQPDTVIVETPLSSDEIVPSATEGQDEVTITRGGPVTAATTVTIPGVSGGPDTVFIETPTQSSEGPTGTAVQEVTITRGGPITAATTVTIPGGAGEPDTVYIETPTESAGGGSDTPVTGTVQQITITRGGPVTAATTVTISGVSGGPETVYIEIPTDSAAAGTEPPVTGAVQEITVTRGGPVTAATTITIPGASGEPDTVLVEVPLESAELSSETGSVREVTITRGNPVTAAITLTIPGESSMPDTVLIEIPTSSFGDDDEPVTTGSVREVTITRGGPVTAATTLTIPGESGGPDTVLVEIPASTSDEDGSTQVEVTITRGGPVTAATTLTIPGVSGQPDTVVVEIPTESDSGSSETNGGQEEVTVTQGGPGTAATTITLPGVSGGPDTVIIETPTGTFETPNNALANVTVYSGGPVSVTRTIYLPPDTSGDAGTIVIETPDGSSPTETARGPGNVTIYTGIAGTATRTVFIPATTSGAPGTVLIETPTGSSGGEETTGSTVATATGPITTSEGRPNTTIFSVGSGSSTRTLYFPPASDDPDGLGTVVIETPTSGSEEDPEATSSDIAPGGPANITRIVGGPASVTTTIYIPPTASGEPGVVIIETPTSGPEDETTASESAANTAFPVGRQNVTLYSGGPGTVVTTIYYPPASSDLDEPGTVVIQTPTAGPVEEASASSSEAITPIQNITRIVGGPASVTTTIYIPPTASGEPGVVIIETPTASPDDEETSSASITETASDEEATGIPNVTRYVDGPASITTTYTIPPASSGDPGTVVIQTPSASPGESEASVSATEIPNVTRYIGGPASVTTTYTIPPASPGEPGTVVIQAPTASPEESATSSSLAEIPNVTRYVAGPASVTTTYTLPPASSGEPGTVVIQTPSASSAAETTSSQAITSVESASAIQNVTRFVGGPASVTTTIYIPPAASGEPGTVLIQTPSSAPEETSSSAAISTTRPPTVAQNTTIFGGGAGSTTRTIYIPPASEGEPGTVLIETPTASPAASTTPISGAPAGIPTTSTPIVAGTNVTIFRAAPPTATAERTLYDPPTAAGEPGTVIIETMVVSSTSGSAAPLSMEAPASTTLSGAASTTATTSSSAIASPPTTSSSAAVAASSSSSAAAAAASSSSSAVAAAASSSSSVAAAASSSSGAAAAATSSTSPSSAAAAAASSSSSVAAAATSSSSAAAAAASSSSSAAAAASSSSSAAPAPVTTSSTSVAAPVITTSSSAAVPVVATSSSSTSSTSMMPQLAFGPTFDCDGFGYTVQSLLANTLTRVNLVTGQRTNIRTGIGPGGPINGIGFNRLDNYIYGFYQQPLVNALLCGLLGCKRSGLIRIAKDGRWEVLDLVIGTNAISMGDVDDQGRFWVSEGGGKWWCIDLRPTSSTFGKLLNSGTSATSLLSGVGDWAYVPGGGNYLYALQASVIENGLLRTNIVRWSLTTQKWENYQAYPGILSTALNLVWGAVMAAPGGTLFAQESVLGQTWKFTLGFGAPDPTPIPGGAILNLLGSDGAKCAGASV
ncbi:hypothetical protein FPHYL_5059 [Fusarium phyllophilum]|uniref:Uncharacterized protein n=1 Tax=Fusarium phyllophilum TaxID=47803 RepID=A0A8H5NEG7_9HYPO|nr:hypothetical protein FPHYL_5059 [Fusarium phyllophilum]